MSVSVVIAHWYPERERNLTRVVDAFWQGTQQPDEVLIWDNTGRLEPGYFPHAAVLRSPWNVGCKAKFLGALMCHSDYVYLSDNDLVVQADTIRHMLTFAQPDRILTLEGHLLDSTRSYAASKTIQYNFVTTLSPVHTLNCRTDLLPRNLLKQLLPDIPFDDTTIAMHEDLWLAASAQKHNVPRLVVPGNTQQGFTRLSEHGVGMSVTDTLVHDGHSIDDRQRDLGRKPNSSDCCWTPIVEGHCSRCDNPLFPAGYAMKRSHYEDRERFTHQLFDPLPLSIKSTTWLT